MLVLSYNAVILASLIKNALNIAKRIYFPLLYAINKFFLKRARLPHEKKNLKTIKSLNDKRFFKILFINFLLIMSDR